MARLERACPAVELWPRIESELRQGVTSTAETKPRRKRDPEFVRARILDAATDAFALFGFEGATLPKIALAAGVGTPLIIHYFKSKRLLWEAVFERISVRARVTLESIGSRNDLSAADRLRRIIVFQVKFFAETPEIYQLLASEAHHRSDRLTWICDHFARFAFEKVTRTIREAQAEGAVRMLSPERLRYVIISAASTSAISAEYEELTGQDPRTEEQLAATIEFIEKLIFAEPAQASPAPARNDYL